MRTCHVWTAFKIDCRAVVQYWLERRLATKLSKDEPAKSEALVNTPTLLPAQIEKAA
jgi:hypothetical protein